MRTVSEFLLVSFLAACAAPPAGTDAGSFDAGEPDAGETGCDAGYVPGPLGSCVPKPCSDAQGGPCSADTTCCSPAMCMAPGEGFGCGICFPTEDECSDENPCGEGSVCATFPPPQCACEPREFKRCAPACPDTPCASDETCVASVCRPVSCVDGYACPAGARCNATNPDRHGCSRLTCAAHSDCPDDARVCVNGRCFTDSGTCSLAVP